MYNWDYFFPSRCYVSTAVLDGMIYAMGGYDGQHRQNTAERYLPKTNQWSLIHPMVHQRSDASSTALKGKNKSLNNKCNDDTKHEDDNNATATLCEISSSCSSLYSASKKNK